MTLDPKIFKAYDIRGVVPQELDEDGAFLVGQAAARFTKAKTLVVGRDMRKSTPALFKAFARGANGQGADIVDLGLTTTPMFYYGVGSHQDHEAGVMVTASHNPKQYNGFKLCRGDVSPIGGESGMKEVKEIALAGPYPEESAGSVTEADVRGPYLDKIFSFIDVKRIKPLKMIVDCGNGMEGVIINDILGRLPTVEATVLYPEPDGSFPNHEANPLKEETLVDLQKEVLARQADLGTAFDGDADRFGLVDDKGKVVRGDILLALLAPRLLRAAPGAAVFYDVRCSRVVAEEVTRAGGRPLMSPVGHGLIKPRMRAENAILGGELSLHYYFREMFFAEASDLVMLLVLELMSESGRKLSEMVAPLLRYHHSGEINFRVEDKQAVLEKLEKKYGSKRGATVTKIDGLRIDLKDAKNPVNDWFLSVRASNTEPLLRLNLEAGTREMMEEHREELIKQIGGERE